ncbi:Glycoside hydrolase, 38 vacuolar alpha mannosidase [Phlyctochytrium bullatum]|nr:Glycoside hydrolase, 38 vacuolar alpha mannosidase [Phlyctochytrium bullatum]
MQKHRDLTLDRLRIFIQERQYSDVNLRAALTKASTTDGIRLSVYSVPDLKRIPFKEAIKNEFKPCNVGDSFGPSWSTHWFKVEFTIPATFKGEEVSLIFDPKCEGMVWSADGKALMGITGSDNLNEKHVDFPLTKAAKGGEKFLYYIETACNQLFGNARGGIDPPPPDVYYRLDDVRLLVPNREAWELFWDMQILIQLIEETPRDSQINGDALYAGNAIVNTYRRDEKQQDSILECRSIAKEFFASHKKSGAGIHEITAIGNCHIDTAWLWPFDETKRKSARSWSRQLFFMDQGEIPKLQFVASQAQQFEWVERDYPDVFERMLARAKEGKFLPIGGTWVEMDTNVPTGEALVRQFLYGQRYFESRHFRIPQLPQIANEAGIKYFFTQKLSWNNINLFPHTTFRWTGLDGSTLLTHFSPANTYSASGSVRDVTFSVSNNKDKAYSSKSLLLYGNGDGGGGPLVPMVKRLERLEALEGLPATIRFSDPTAFYKELEASSRDLVEWKGELYFELHRGTYTTHGFVKKYNRTLEILLRQVEFVSTLAVNLKGVVTGFVYPKADLDRLWKTVLLCQFHDVLPGSSIHLVYEDAAKLYAGVKRDATALLETALKAVVGRYGDRKGDGAQAVSVFNTTPWPLSAVVEVDLGELHPGTELFRGTTWRQLSSSRKALTMVTDVPPMAIAPFDLGHKPAMFSHVTATKGDRVIIISNNFITLVLDEHGRIKSLVERATGREAMATGQLGNVFKLFEDQPLYWDAWDVEVYHLEKAVDAELGQAEILEFGPVRVVVAVTHPLTSTSTMEQRIIVHALSGVVEFETKVNWNENRTLLKVEFPVDVWNDVATYETQFGVLARPTHYNTSWELAKFEVCGHKFVDYSEFGFGVALLTDCKYGYSVKDRVMRISLLRSPKAPDASTDVGLHEFRYAIYPHKGSFAESDVVQKAYQFNTLPIVKPILINRAYPETSASGEFFTVESSTVVIDTVKLAEDPRKEAGVGKDVIVRLYESVGGRGSVTFRSLFPIKKANLCNVMEDLGEALQVDGGNSVVLKITPFKFVTLRLVLE